LFAPQRVDDFLVVRLLLQAGARPSAFDTLVSLFLYVFFNPQRTNTHIRSVKTAWHNALRLAGLSPFPNYQCRHTFATRLAAAGVSDTIIDQLLGHSRRDVLRFYTARVPEYLRDAINLLDKLRDAKTESVGSRIEVAEERSEKGPTLIN
jgi:integrase